MRTDPTLEQIGELMDELDAYHHRTVVIKNGGNSIAEDEHFITKIARQVKFLRQNGVRVVLVHGGGPQIDDALRDKKIETSKGKDGRRITSPKAMAVVHKVMKDINLQVADAIIAEGVQKENVVTAARSKNFFVTAEPLDKQDGGKTNRSGKPKSVDAAAINKILDQKKILVLHSVGGDKGGEPFNINGDDYAMQVAIGLKAKRLILVTNVAGVMDKEKKRIPLIDRDMARELLTDGTITGGMVPKVESAIWVVKQGVGGVAIIDGFRPWAILAEMLTHEGFGTLFKARIV